MPDNTSRLGKGLDALIPTEVDEFMSADTPKEVKTEAGNVVEVEVGSVSPNPHQPREHFDEAQLEELAESIKVHGVIQPLVVSRSSGGYELIAGERRLRASKLAGLKKVPVIIRSSSQQEKLEVALIENVQRSELKPLERAAAYSKLVDQFNMTGESIGKRVGKSAPAISNSMRLLKLDKGVKKALNDERITEGHARAILLAGDDPVVQRQLLARIINRNVTVRDAEDLARTFKHNPGRSHKAADKKHSQSNALTQELGRYLETKVSVQPMAKGGRLIIEYYSDEELDRIFEQITGGN